MKRFRFKFASVEKVRKTRMEDAMRVLAQAQRAHQNAVQFRNSLNAQLAETLQKREALGVESTGIHDFQLANNYITGTKLRILHAENAIKRATKNVEKALREFLQMRKQLKMIELLREKDFEEFKKQRGKSEQKATDDIYVMRAQFAAVEEGADAQFEQGETA